MNIAVCIKQVPASDSRLMPSPESVDIKREGLSYVVNPYDEFGLEEALQIRERLGGGQVTVLTIGPEKAAEALRTCLAMGADCAVHLKDPTLEGADTYTTAVVLAAALKKQPYDIIFFGKQAIDDDGAAVGIYVAEFMGLPHVAVVNKLDLFPGERRAVAHRQIEGAIEVVEVSLPAIFTCQKGLNEPRYASLPGIMRAKQKPLSIFSLQELGLTPRQVGGTGAKCYIQHLVLPATRPTGKIFSGDVTSSVAALVQHLREDIKILP